MNGPIPIMLIMLSAVAWTRPKRRTSGESVKGGRIMVQRSAVDKGPSWREAERATGVRQVSDVSDTGGGRYGGAVETRVPQEDGNRCDGCGCAGGAGRHTSRQSARPADREPDLASPPDDQGRQLRRAGQSAHRHRRPASRDVLAARLQ